MLRIDSNWFLLFSSLSPEMSNADTFTLTLEDIFAELTEILDSIKALKDTKYNQALVLFNRTEALERRLDDVKADIFSFNAECTDPKDRVNLRKFAFSTLITAIKTYYFELKEKRDSKNLSESSQASGSETQESRASKVRLPKIDIPIFSGTIQEWSHFHSLFDSLIHQNSSLSDVEKFQYLRTLLKGNALKLIENLHLSASNYFVAYDTIKRRYEDKRLKANYYMKQIQDFKGIPSDSPSNLQAFLLAFKTNVEALRALKLPDLSDFMLFHKALSNLDSNSRQLFETEFAKSDIPSFDDLMTFVSERLKISSLCTDQKGASQRVQSRGVASQSLVSTTQSEVVVKCPFCSDLHKPQKCSKLLDSTIEDRYTMIREANRCLACLGKHYLRQCSSTFTCQVCKSKYHHTLLHREKSTREDDAKVVQNQREDMNSPHQVYSCSVKDVAPKRQILLGTAQACIQAADGQFKWIRLVIDSGSQLSFITEACAQMLGLRKFKTTANISGISDNQSTQPLGVVSCILKSSLQPTVRFQANAVVLKKITSDLPSFPVDSSLTSKFSHVKLADSHFGQTRQIDFLLGADLYTDVLLDKPIIRGKPAGIHTAFGVILLGEVTSRSDGQSQVALLTNVQLERSLQRFWQLEEVVPKTVEDPMDRLCEEHFQMTTKRDEGGRYIVSLPFDPASKPLESNRVSALSRYKKLESCLSREPNRAKEYNEFLSQYQTLTHMQAAKDESPYVIPHHGVVKESSSTTRLRVVFDASAKDSTGISLNDRLLKGPKLQKEVPELIALFRLFPVALSSDLKMMFRQILISPSDRKNQHIFWRPSSEAPIGEFELNTVTYGLKSSPYLAQRVLRQLVNDEGSEYPLASSALINNIFMDDIVAGADSEEQALELYRELNALLSKGGFFPRKWRSSAAAVLEKIPAEDCELPLVLRDAQESGFKILGLEWHPEIDCFSYSIQASFSAPTKRSVLSQIARIYDPSGWLCPIVFWAKNFIQQLWQSGLDWDSPLPTELEQCWSAFCSQLSFISRVSIPRLIPVKDCLSQLVGFSDASSKGYAAVIYVICTTAENVSVHLLTAKSRVSPLKTTTIPRLELNAALLLSRLLSSIQLIVKKMDIQSTRLFTDSTIVLAWLRTPPHLLKPYEANRVVEILDNTSITMWSHVSTELNSADCASRGMLPAELVDHEMWWQGPQFLQTPPDGWPELPSEDLPMEIPGLKQPFQSLVSNHDESSAIVDDCLSRCSSFPRFIRIMAYVLRFGSIRDQESTPRPIGPSVGELREATLCCVKLIQRKHFSAEIKSLEDGNQCSRSLAALAPFLDTRGLLRVGGRLRHSPLSYDAKHPLLLPSKDQFTLLLCEDVHKITGHAGPTAMLAFLQRQYWIMAARNLVRKCIIRCTRCYRFKASPVQGIMADLPPSRFSQIRPFLQVGVDFCGPITIRESMRRKAVTSKAYICVFVCLSVKAVHIELVSDLSTAAFLAALDRFTARRGLASDIYSDCGTNFQGASNEIRSFLRDADTDVAFHLTRQQVKWHFNPPAAPNFGGIWEAAVKSTKHHLLRIVGNHKLTFEEMTTVLTRIEAILNSRPLCSNLTDPNDGNDYLSPGHFIIGQPLLALPEPDLTNLPVPRLARWQLMKQCTQEFWSRWRNDYLQTLTKRSKWTQPGAHLEIGDLVLVLGFKTSPLDWPLGRIEQLITGRDGIARIAKVRVGSSIFTRPMNKLVIFPHVQEA